MRRTTLILLGILAAGFGALLYVGYRLSSELAAETRRGRVITGQVADRLEPGTSVRVRRVTGQSTYVVTDPDRPGVLVNAQPRRDAWSTDPSGEAFAQAIARPVLEAYVPEFTVSWLQFRLTRPDGAEAPVFGLERAPDGTLRKVRAPAGP